MKPKEDPQEMAARLRERRLSEVERDKATKANTRSMTQELASIYGLRGDWGLFSGMPQQTRQPGANRGSRL